MPQIPWLIVGFGFAVGLVIGSFLNVVIHRVPSGLSIVKPRSRCPRCENPIASFDNIPVLSWLILRGRCRHCQLAISPRYPAVEFGTGLAFAVIVAVHGLSPMTLVFWVFAAMMIAVAGIDWDEQWIPDSLSLGGLALGLTVVPAVQGWIQGSYSDALLSSLVGAVLGGGLLWAVGFVHARVSVWTGRQFAHWPGEGEDIPRPGSLDYWVWFPGLGFGDVKLMAIGRRVPRAGRRPAGDLPGGDSRPGPGCGALVRLPRCIDPVRVRPRHRCRGPRRYRPSASVPWLSRNAQLRRRCGR